MRKKHGKRGSVCFDHPHWASLVALLASLVCSSAWAQTRLSVEDVIGQRRVSDPRISPDGEWVVYVVTQPRPEGRAPNSDLYLVKADGDTSRRLTHNPGQDDHPRFSPDGTWIAFLSKRGQGPEAKTQIRLLPVAGGESQAVSAETTSVESLAWSPDGGRIAYSVRQPKDAARREQELQKLDHQDSDRILHRRLKVIDLADRSIRTLSPVDRSVFDFCWSPDGERLAAFTASAPDAGQGYWKARLVLMDTESGQLSPLFEGGSSTKLLFSPDGKRLAFLVPPGKRYARASPALISVDGGPVQVLAPKHEGAIWDFVWHPKGRELILWGHRGLEGFVGSVPARGGPVRVWYELPLRAWGNPGITISRDGRWLAVLAEHPRHPPEVYLASRTPGPLPPRRLSRSNPDLENRALGQVEAIHWQAADGLRIEGVLVHPPGAAPSKASALVVMVHGGPQWQYWRGWLGNWHEPAQWLAAAGYRVLLPNPRGSTGRGSAFARLAREDWGGRDLQDILSGVDHLVQSGQADPNRLGIVGWSYGGYMTAWAVTQTPRFKAAVAGAAVTNLTSMQGTSDIPPFLPDQFDASPYSAPERFVQRSPVFSAKQVQTPTLIVHGEQDVRVPVSQARELYQALREASVTTRLLTFPREGHHFSETGHQRVLLEQMLAWLKRFVPTG